VFEWDKHSKAVLSGWELYPPRGQGERQCREAVCKLFLTSGAEKNLEDGHGVLIPNFLIFKTRNSLPSGLTLKRKKPVMAGAILSHAFQH